MDRIKYLILSLCVLGAVFVFYEPHESKSFQTDFPLTAETVTDALSRSGLAGEISETETDSWAEGHSLFVIRDRSKATEAVKNGRFVASLSSVAYEDGRVLYATFDQEVASEQIDWEAWRQQLILAALLYGGSEDGDAIYRAFLENELPEGAAQAQWTAQLSGGYCAVAYMPRTNTTYDENNIPVKQYAAHLQVNLYESYELCQAIAAQSAALTRVSP